VNSYSVDLHVHSALSPCAAEEMTPPAIVQAAIDRGLGIIAICDHNAAGNTAATQEAAGETAKVVVLAGIEITTTEEVHVVGLFGSSEAAVATAEAVRATLPGSTAESRSRFGEQRLMDSHGRVIGFEEKMLAAASTLDLAGAVQLIRRNHGIAVAAHVNRKSFSVLSQLGLFPSDVEFDAIEVFSPCGPQQVDARATAAAKFRSFGPPVIASSDAHFLADIGRAHSEAVMEAPTFDELVLALRGVGGRSVGCA
jgi:predicted metal-dependent phosphoesterase TrpH